MISRPCWWYTFHPGRAARAISKGVGAVGALGVGAVSKDIGDVLAMEALAMEAKHLLQVTSSQP
jgi:hypothetical protein